MKAENNANCLINCRSLRNSYLIGALIQRRSAARMAIVSLSHRHFPTLPTEPMPMTIAYFWTNTVLYVVFAAWCTFAQTKSAAALGFLKLSPAGQTEYVVVYGGLQLALALLFGAAAMGVVTPRVGLMMSLAIYAPLVVYRAIAWLIHKPDSATALATAILEITLLTIAVFLYLKSN
jgi:hypothetical protein